MAVEQRPLNLTERQQGYPAGFWSWLRANRHIYMAFERKAILMAKTGRKRYSARAIVHIIRWETDLREKDKTFKINNNYTPGMARYFLERHGRHYPKFFQLRDSMGRDQ